MKRLSSIFPALCCLVCYGLGILIGWGITRPSKTESPAASFFHYLDKNGKCQSYPGKDGDAALCKTEAGLVALCTAPAGAPPDCKVILDTRPRPPQAAATPPAPVPVPTPAPTPPKAGAGSHTPHSK